VVRLTADIANHSGICIYQQATFNGEVFDCQGHTIDGTDSASSYGIYLRNRSRDTIEDCVITDFYEGIYAEVSSYNTLTGNTLISNQGYGVDLYSSDHNLCYNNYFQNAQNARDLSPSNTWNITKTSGTNIIGGPYLGGNYWNDYTGADTNGDGLGDTNLPYNSNGNITNGDYAPLATPSAPVPVGGIAELPDVAEAHLEGSDSSGPSTGTLAALAAGGVLVFTAAAWYVRRRLNA
jgi:parallel beta-helix repeat protein